jgi:hypothetical protein
MKIDVVTLEEVEAMIKPLFLRIEELERKVSGKPGTFCKIFGAKAILFKNYDQIIAPISTEEIKTTGQ